MKPLDPAARLAMLQAENDELRERVAALMRVLRAEHQALPPEWRLSRSQAKAFGALLARPTASKAAIMAALYGDRVGDEPGIEITNVWISQLRRKLAPFGIEIRSIWGYGYALPPETRARLAGELAAA